MVVGSGVSDGWWWVMVVMGDDGNGWRWVVVVMGGDVSDGWCKWFLVVVVGVIRWF